MTLRVDITNCKDWETLDPAFLEVMGTACMLVGMGEITEKNAEQFYARVHACEAVCGITIMRGREGEPRPITPADIRRYIGLHANIIPITNAAFAKKLLEWATEDARREWKKEN